MITIIAFVIVLGILIFIHELGHFLLAKYNGVGVLKFSLGFGPAIFRKKIGETEYMLSSIPLGGYVKMLGEDQNEEAEQLSGMDPARSFAKKSLKQRAAIVVAGPLFNLLLAIVIYMTVAWIGLPFFSPVIGTVLKDSPADKAGMKGGDKIISIQGKPVESWDDIPALMEGATAKTRYEIIIERDSNQYTVHVSPIMTKGTNIFGEEIDRGMIGISRDIGAVIAKVAKDSPAEKVGLKPGDRVISIGSKPVDSLDQLAQIMKDAKPEAYTPLVVERGNASIAASLPPAKGKSVDIVAHREVTMPAAGISFVMPEIERKSLGFIGGIGFGFTKSWQIVELTGIGVWKMLNGTIDAKKSLGGPILIAQVSGQTFRSGMIDFFSLIAFISINLFLINLLPIPVLDGGHIMLFAIEGITGRPVREKAREVAQQIGLFILVVLMLLAFYNDITRLFQGG